MNTYYVSLTRDLLGIYLEFQAESAGAVRAYLEAEYYDAEHRTWRLPWCGVYSSLPKHELYVRAAPVVVKAQCGPILRGDYA